MKPEEITDPRFREKREEIDRCNAEMAQIRAKSRLTKKDRRRLFDLERDKNLAGAGMGLAYWPDADREEAEREYARREQERLDTMAKRRPEVTVLWDNNIQCISVSFTDDNGQRQCGTYKLEGPLHHSMTDEERRKFMDPFGFAKDPKRAAARALRAMRTTGRLFPFAGPPAAKAASKRHQP